jgi:hypothetical protein
VTKPAPARLDRLVHDWPAKYEQAWNGRLGFKLIL